MLLGSAIERLYDLHVGTTPVQEGAPHEKPHKPLLLLAAFDLIDEGLATPERIPWCKELRDRFTARFLIVKKHNDQNNPDLPFRYLAGDGFWQAFEGDASTPIYNLDITNPHIGESVSHDPAELLATYARQQGEIQDLRDQLNSILSEALSR